MEIGEEASARSKMESLRQMCDRDISVHQQKMDSFASSFFSSLESTKVKSQENVQNQGRLSKMKSSLKEAEDGLVKALAVKTRAEAKRMITTESISTVKARVEELKRILHDQKARRDEYAAIISRESLALDAKEEKSEQHTKRKEEIEEAISWYNRVLGLKIQGGSGVKFMFNNVDAKTPDEVYSFTIRFANDTYTLLQCDPPIDGTKELVLELNKNNDLYKFVRIMRRKFQEAAAEGPSPQMVALPQESSTISVSAPVASVYTDISETPAKVNKNFKKYNMRASSPGSASSLRRSSRLSKIKK